MTTFYIEQFGCRATQADGAAIERQLRERGCTATAAADAQARDAIRKIHAASPSTRIIVTGCYAQRAPEEIAALPGVSFVVGNSHKPQIPQLFHSISPLRSLIGAELVYPDNAEFPPARSAEDSSSVPLAPILAGDISTLTDVLVAPVLGGEGNH